MKKTHTSKQLRVKLSILTGLIFGLIEGLLLHQVMAPETMVFWLPVTAICAVVVMFGVNDAMRKAASE